MALKYRISINIGALMKNTLIATLFTLAFSSTAFAGPGALLCKARELVPGNQGRSGIVLIDEHQAAWQGANGQETSLCQLAQFSDDDCFATRSSRNLVLELNASCGEVRMNIPMAEAHLTLAKDHGRYSCIQRAQGLVAQLELSGCRAAE